MDPKTADVLQQLADRLGVTLEHLWGVLLYQAKVAFWTDAVYLIAFGAAVYGLVRMIRASVARVEKDDVDLWGLYGATFGAIAALVLSAVILLGLIPEMINTAVNPEYWALKQVLPGAAK